MGRNKKELKQGPSAERDFSTVDEFLGCLSGCADINEDCEVTRQRYVSTLSKEKLLISNGFQTVAHLCALNGFVVPFYPEVMREIDFKGRTVAQILAESGKMPVDYMTDEILDIHVPNSFSTVRNICRFAGILPPDKIQPSGNTEAEQEKKPVRTGRKPTVGKEFVPDLKKELKEKFATVKTLIEFRALSYEERCSYVKSRGEEFLLHINKYGNCVAGDLLTENSLPVEMMSVAVLNSKYKGQPLAHLLVQKGLVKNMETEMGKALEEGRLNAYDRAYLRWYTEQRNKIAPEPVENNEEGWKKMLRKEVEEMIIRDFINGTEKEQRQGILNMVRQSAITSDIVETLMTKQSNGKPLIATMLPYIDHLPPRVITKELLSTDLGDGSTVRDYLVARHNLRDSLAQIQEDAKNGKLTEVQKKILTEKMGNLADKFIKNWEKEGEKEREKKKKEMKKKPPMEKDTAFYM